MSRATVQVCKHPPEPVAATTRQDKRLPSLDGLRAVSISMVLFHHLLGPRGFANIPWLYALGNWGNMGVRMFFVLSGFLITTLLLEEHQAKGRISLRQFYLRRAFRILPASYAYIAAVCILAACNIVIVNGTGIVMAVTYVMNYREVIAPHAVTAGLGHLWSLAVEEQFYMFWPLVFCVAGPKRGMWCAATILLLVPCARYLTAKCGHTYVGMYYMFHTVADALATGCLLAGTRNWLARMPAYRWFITSRAFIIVPIAAGCIVVWGNRYSGAMFVVGIGALNSLIALCIDRVLRVPRDISGRLLNWGPIVWVGQVSYSLYLWQQLFLVYGLAHPYGTFPLSLVLTGVAACGSYYLIERPFLLLRRRFHE